MISYRQATEGVRGNGLAEKLYTALTIASITSHQIPRSGWGKFPSFAEKPQHARLEQAKIFLDVKCLLVGSPWKEGFVKGLAKSMVFVPLLSWLEDGTGSVGSMQSLKDDECDNVLLELTLALELVRIEQPLFATRAILPVFVGENTASGYVPFDMSKVHILSDEPHLPTIREAAKILHILSLPRDHIEQRSVRATIEEIVAHQGVMLEKDENVHLVAAKVLQRVAHEIQEAPHHPGMFEQTRPQGRDVLQWLRMQSLWSYAPLFVRHHLDSLYLIAQLSPAHCEALAEEQHRARGDTERFGERVRLIAAVRELRTDDRAALLKHQLDAFNDRQVSALTAMIGGSGIEVALSTPLTRMLLLLLAAISLVGAGFYLWAIADADPNDNDADDDVSTLSRYSVLVLTASVLLAGVLLLVAFIQAQFFRPMAAKRTLHRLLVLLVPLSMTSVVLDGLNLSARSNPSMRGSEVWHFAFALSLALTLAMLLGVFNKHNRFFLLTFLTVFGAWAVIFGAAKPSTLGLASHEAYTFSAEASTLCVVVGVFSLLSAMMLLALYFYGQHKARKEASVMVTMFEATWAAALQGKTEAGSTANRALRRKKSGEGHVRLSSCTETALKELATKSQDVNGVLEKQRVFWRRWKFRVMRWFGQEAWTRKRFAWRYRGKIKQAVVDMDVLFGHATEVNDTFHDLIAEIVGAVHVGRLLRGPIKQTSRAIQKAFRCYGRDASCLTDIVRCTVVFDSIPDMATFFDEIVSRAQIGFPEQEKQAWEFWQSDVVGSGSAELPRQETIKLIERGEDSAADTHAKVSRREQRMRITRLKNRTDPDFDVWQSAGFRGVSMSIEVGWVMEASGALRLLAVEKWEQVDAATHICELQLQLSSMSDLSTDIPTYQYYVRWRNLLSR